jgi:hypothetical protein
MARKLSIVMSEPVARDSYEAGVVREVLEAIFRHNAEVVNAEQRIEVEVATDVSHQNHLYRFESLPQTLPFVKDEETRLTKLPHFKLRLKTIKSELQDHEIG